MPLIIMEVMVMVNTITTIMITTDRPIQVMAITHPEINPITPEMFQDEKQRRPAITLPVVIPEDI